jgi:leucyl-tRNA synthetase
MISPMAPHIAEELWQRLGHEASIAYADWPQADPKYLEKDEIEVVVQVNGKKRANILVSKDATQEEIEKTCKENEGVQRHTEGKTIRKLIYVPGRLINIVAN